MVAVARELNSPDSVDMAAAKITAMTWPARPRGRWAVEMVEDEDQHPREQDQELHGHLEERVEEQREPALGETAPGQVALDLALIAPEVRQHDEEAADEAAPERVGGGEAGREVHDPEAPRRLGQGEAVAQGEAGGELRHREAEAEEDAEPDDGQLDHIGPDHGPVPSITDVHD